MLINLNTEDNKNPQCFRKIHFCAGHRVMNHESKCVNLHGHNYLVWVYAIADNLDNLGRVIDFSVLKEKVGGWIDQFWDHTTILNEKDIDLISVLQPINKKPVYIMPYNPTAENMAIYLLNNICPQLMRGTGVKISNIIIYETENCGAIL